jgi:hypothetical protein
MTTTMSFPLVAAMILGAAGVSAEPPEDIVLFDCLGTIQRLSGSDFSVSHDLHVSAVDSSLPVQVRDGCSIHAGWYDRAAHGVVLVVQTERLLDDEDEPAARQLTLTIPTLTPMVGEARTFEPPRRPDGRAIRARLEAIESPFARSAGYALSNSTTSRRAHGSGPWCQRSATLVSTASSALPRAAGSWM